MTLGGARPLVQTPAGKGRPHTMRDPHSGSIQLLKVDPELARGLDVPRAREAAERLYTRAIDVPRGRGPPAPWLTGGSQPIGLLVLEGLLVREATVSNHP